MCLFMIVASNVDCEILVIPHLEITHSGPNFTKMSDELDGYVLHSQYI